MKLIKAAIVAVTFAASLSAIANTTYSTYGNTTYGSNGTTMQTYGTTT